jgi:LAO/AO transport system kinase
VLRHEQWLREHGEFDAKRRRQLVEWTRAMVRDRLLGRLDEPSVRAVIKRAEAEVVAEELTPDQAANQIIAAVDERA